MLWLIHKLPVWLRSRLDPVELLVRLVLGGTFIFSGIYKIRDPQAFELIIRNYKILGDPFIALTAMTLPPLELIIGSCLLLRVIYKGAVFLSLLLLITFIASLASLIIRGIDIDCGCFGLNTTIQMQILLDLILGLGATYLFYFANRTSILRLLKR